MNRNIGISLDDEYTGFTVDEETESSYFPTVIARDRQAERWTIGEDAYKETLSGHGVIVDKLVSLIRKDGTATIGDVRYEAVDLLAHFFHVLLQGASTDPVELSTDYIVVSIRKPERRVMEHIREALVRAGAEPKNIEIQSYMESFSHFVLGQDKTLYNRMVGMYELSNQVLTYYEMRVSRGTRKFVLVASEEEEEAFNLDILKSASGQKIADRLLRTVAERTLSKNSFSAVFLSGRGFQDTSLVPDFMNFVCTRRRVLIEPALFSVGAMFYAGMLREGREEEYTILCDTRVSSDVSFRVSLKEKERSVPIVKAGSSWTSAGAVYEFILDDQDYIDFEVSSLIDPKRSRRLRMVLSDFPKRENRTTRVSMDATFRDAKTLIVSVTDLGFGDLFPGSGAQITEQISLED